MKNAVEKCSIQQLHTKTHIPSVTTLHCDRSLDSDGVVIVVNCQQHGN